MAWPTSAFPTSLDSITRKNDTTDEIVADDQNGAYDCIEHLQAKVGVDNSTVTTSLDYLLRNTSSSNPGHKHTLANGATDVTATAAEVNLIDGTVAGTAVASKALALGANKNIDTIVIADGGLKLGSGSGTAITATAAEINAVCDGYVGGLKAWANIKGTETVSIRASANVTSVTDLGTGWYRINFTSALADNKYAVVASCARADSSGSVSASVLVASPVNYHTSYVEIITGDNSSDNNVDALHLDLAIFR